MLEFDLLFHELNFDILFQAKKFDILFQVLLIDILDRVKGFGTRVEVKVLFPSPRVAGLQ